MSKPPIFDTHTIISRQGQPNIGIVGQQLPIYIKKDMSFGYFSAPYPLLGNKAQIFQRFNLWESSNGICADGIIHDHRNSGKFDIRTKKPILAGDYVKFGNKKFQVIASRCQLLDATDFWACHVSYGILTLPTEQPEPETDDLLVGIIQGQTDMISALTDSLNKQTDLIDSIVSEILPQCTAGPYPILTAPALPAWLTKIEQIKAEIDNQKENLEKQKDETSEAIWQ